MKKERLKEILLERSVFFGDFTLSSGKKSNFYIDARISTLFPESSYLIAEIMFEILKEYKIDAVGGYSIGADPIVSAIAVVSYLKKNPIPAFIIRKEEKKHGRGKAIEGNFSKGMRVAIVDDVITTGGSIIKGINKVKEMGAIPIVALSVIDREEGGREKIEKMGIPLYSIFNLNDLGIKKE